MRRAAPAAGSVVVPGAGHAPTLTEPEALAAIDGFLSRIAP
jgi:pimeloyl-ACP methyl ester carboxylesterase